MANRRSREVRLRDFQHACQASQRINIRGSAFLGDERGQPCLSQLALADDLLRPNLAQIQKADEQVGEVGRFVCQKLHGYW